MVRPSVVTVGMEREYSIVANDGAERFFATGYQDQVLERIAPALVGNRWQLVPEYTSTIVELISPPYKIGQYENLVSDLERLEGKLKEVTFASGDGLSVTVVNDFSCMTFPYICRRKSEPVTDPQEILLNAQDDILGGDSGCSGELPRGLNLTSTHVSFGVSDNPAAVTEPFLEEIATRGIVLSGLLFDPSPRTAFLRQHDSGFVRMLDQVKNRRQESGGILNAPAMYGVRRREINALDVYEFRFFPETLPVSEISNLFAFAASMH